VTPGEVFDPSAALDPTRFMGPEGAARLVEAAQHFPGGPVALVLTLFFAPVGPGIPAGVLLARHVPLNPAITFALYALSDVMAAIVCHPIFVVLRRHGARVKPIRWLGRHVLSLAMIGVRTPQGPDLAPKLFRTAGMLVTGLRVPRIPGWASAIAGDLVWFALLLATSFLAASIADDDRFVAVAMIVAMIVIPRIAQRVFPSLRPDAG
jgi:hypothetical protein